MKWIRPLQDEQMTLSNSELIKPVSQDVNTHRFHPFYQSLVERNFTRMKGVSAVRQIYLYLGETFEIYGGWAISALALQRKRTPSRTTFYAVWLWQRGRLKHLHWWVTWLWNNSCFHENSIHTRQKQSSHSHCFSLGSLKNECLFGMENCEDIKKRKNKKRNEKSDLQSQQTVISIMSHTTLLDLISG